MHPSPIRPRRLGARAGAVLATAAALAACGGETAGDTGSGAQVVAVEEVEYALSTSSSSLEPGSATFRAENAGTTEHALAVEGPALDGPATATIAPGESADLTVTLEEGRYVLYCPVEGHRELGMQIEIAVGAPPPAEPPPAEPATTDGVGDRY